MQKCRKFQYHSILKMHNCFVCIRNKGNCCSYEYYQYKCFVFSHMAPSHLFHMQFPDVFFSHGLAGLWFICSSGAEEEATMHVLTFVLLVGSTLGAVTSVTVEEFQVSWQQKWMCQKLMFHVYQCYSIVNFLSFVLYFFLLNWCSNVYFSWWQIESRKCSLFVFLQSTTNMFSIKL